MKTILISILTSIVLTLSVIPSFAADPINAGQLAAAAVTNIVVPTTTVQLVDKFGDKLDQYINALASKAGVAAKHFYPIFVRQQRITGIFELSLMFIGIVLSILLFLMAWIFSKNNEKYGGEGKTTLSTIGAIFLIIVTGIGMAAQGRSDSIGKVFNPEYNAVQCLVQMVK